MLTWSEWKPGASPFLAVRRAIRRCGLAVVLFTGAMTAGAAQGAHYGVDLEGKPLTGLATEGSRVVVLFFAASDCPISNRYLPEMKRLHQEFADEGAAFWEVFPNPEDSAEVLRKHDEEYSDPLSIVRDVDQSLVSMAHATVTPEAAVFVKNGAALREVYHGRIDDRYLAFGSERPHAQHHDLEDAIRAALEGKPVQSPGGPPVGCAIVTLHP